MNNDNTNNIATPALVTANFIAHTAPDGYIVEVGEDLFIANDWATNEDERVAATLAESDDDNDDDELDVAQLFPAR